MTPETLIIRHCAPTLAGLKSSSLVCLKFACGDLAGTLARLASKGVGFRFFCNAHGCPLLFVYRPWALKRILSDRRVEDHLVEDVLSFIENGGRGFRHSGMWKMYHDIEGGMRLERMFSDCTRCMLDRFDTGVPIEDLCAV